MNANERPKLGMIALPLLLLLGCMACGAVAGPAAPGDLLNFIRAQQREHIRISTGIWAHECFTDVDLKAFLDAGKPGAIATRLRKSRQFLAIVEVVKAMPEVGRKNLLAEARGVAHPTWAMLGEIRSDGSGQTEAGRRAELLLAGAIVDEIERALREAVTAEKN